MKDGGGGGGPKDRGRGERQKKEMESREHRVIRRMSGWGDRVFRVGEG